MMVQGQEWGFWYNEEFLAPPKEEVLEDKSEKGNMILIWSQRSRVSGADLLAWSGGTGNLQGQWFMSRLFHFCLCFSAVHRRAAGRAPQAISRPTLHSLGFYLRAKTHLVPIEEAAFSQVPPPLPRSPQIPTT